MRRDPTPTQRKILARMVRGCLLFLNKNNRRYYLGDPHKGSSAAAPVRTASFKALQRAGWVDTDMRRESGMHVPMRLMPSGRAASRRRSS